jgi:D-alanyl-D-alanine carboxypeptidase (penicillin-binding protein 5/6)
MAIGSANDATVALAEFVAGSEQEFVQLMNDEAKRMGMTTAHFANSTGLDIKDMPEEFRTPGDQETVMSAKDAAILARYIVTDHPDFNQFTSLQTYKFRERDKTPIVNLNWMLEANKDITNFKKYAYEGLDGLKTGHTQNAGNCFTGTAVRNGHRLISVVMGTSSDSARFVETRKVLDYGFNNFETKQVVAPDATVTGSETITVKKAKNTEIPLVSSQEVAFVVPKGADISKVESKVTMTPESASLTAPLPKGTKVGTVTYTLKPDGMNQTLEKTVDLITSQDAEKANWFKLFMRAIGDFFSDLFNGIKNLF